MFKKFLRVSVIVFFKLSLKEVRRGQLPRTPSYLNTEMLPPAVICVDKNFREQAYAML